MKIKLVPEPKRWRQAPASLTVRPTPREAAIRQINRRSHCARLLTTLALGKADVEKVCAPHHEAFSVERAIGAVDAHMASLGTDRRRPVCP